jgi:hypothetical protein
LQCSKKWIHPFAGTVVYGNAIGFVIDPDSRLIITGTEPGNGCLGLSAGLLPCMSEHTAAESGKMNSFTFQLQEHRYRMQ